MAEHISQVINGLDASASRFSPGVPRGELVEEGIPDYLAAKGVSLSAVHGLASGRLLLGKVIDNMLLGNQTSTDTDPRYNRRKAHSVAERQIYLNYTVADAYSERDDNDHATDAYHGTNRENRAISELITDGARTHERNYRTSEQRAFRNNGASRNLWSPHINLAEDAYKPERLASVPIAIVGCGASGILSAAYLREIGFTNVTIFDKRGRNNGIWEQDNVAGGSKNNPFEITFLNKFRLRSARDSRNLDGSGKDIKEFLDAITTEADIEPVKASVKSIKPGDLCHEITYVYDGETKTEAFPIVIYAPGNGEPLDPNDPSRMTTPMKKNEVGQRWQRQFTPNEIENLGRVVLIGLGNSTAEIVSQLQQHGNTDYRIITHHSMGALLAPLSHIRGESSVYRNLCEPNLTSLAGDLTQINRMFLAARDGGRIVPSVRRWSHEGNVLSAIDDDGIETRIPFDKLFTLIGYGQNIKVNDEMGLSTADSRTGSIDYDFDGEVQRREQSPYQQKPRDRIHPGYFALGSILKNRHNPNALVIPGIQYQLQLLGSTLVLRAAEYAYGGDKSKSDKRRWLSSGRLISYPTHLK